MQANKAASGGFTLIEVLVALSVLSLGIAGTAKLTEIGYLQVAAAENYRNAAYLAHSHLNTLDTEARPETPYQSGRYNERFRWELSLTPLLWEEIFAQNSQLEELAPASMQGSSGKMTDKVNALRADLTVWFENDTRSLDFHTLVLSAASQ